MNYPNEQLYTRITDFKYLTGQVHPKTAVVYEFPKAEGDPYYPVPRPENAELYKKYQQLAATMTNTYFVGRLATYKYYNMDQVVAQSLTTFKKISQGEKEESIVNGKNSKWTNQYHHAILKYGAASNAPSTGLTIHTSINCIFPGIITGSTT